MRSGECFERPTLAPAITEPVSSSLLPTPAASNPNDGEDPEQWQERHDRHASKEEGATRAGTPLSIAVRMLPPSTASDFRGATSPEACKDWEHRGVNLPERVQRLRLPPTPLARDGGGRGASVSKYERDVARGAGPNLDDTMLALSRGATSSPPSDATSEQPADLLQLLSMIEDD
jgi:hypothetical protein